MSNIFFQKEGTIVPLNLVDLHGLYHKFTEVRWVGEKNDITLGELDVMRVIKVNFTGYFIKIIKKLIELECVNNKFFSGRTMLNMPF